MPMEVIHHGYAIKGEDMVKKTGSVIWKYYMLD